MFLHCSAPEGFASVSKAYSAGAVFMPLCVDDAPFAMSGSCDPYLAVQAYSKYERAIDSLPRPLLVSCKSGRRAGAVIALYLAMQNKWNLDEVMKYSEMKGIGL